MSWFPSILAFAFLYHALDYSLIFWHKHLPVHLRILPLIFFTPRSTQNLCPKYKWRHLVPTAVELPGKLFTEKVMLLRSLLAGMSHGHPGWSHSSTQHVRFLCNTARSWRDLPAQTAALWPKGFSYVAVLGCAKIQLTLSFVLFSFACKQLSDGRNRAVAAGCTFAARDWADSLCSSYFEHLVVSRETCYCNS